MLPDGLRLGHTLTATSAKLTCYVQPCIGYYIDLSMRGLLQFPFPEWISACYIVILLLPFAFTFRLRGRQALPFPSTWEAKQAWTPLKG